MIVALVCLATDKYTMKEERWLTLVRTGCVFSLEKYILLLPVHSSSFSLNQFEDERREYKGESRKVEQNNTEIWGF